jgi:ornithine cyclodeaminase/alanine dehydrogenase-like protein (mu-crystallin family)
MDILMLSADDVRSVTTMPEAVAAMRTALIELHRGTIAAPLRTPVTTEHGTSFFMPAGASDAIGIKIVSAFAGNPVHYLPVINGVYVLLDHTTGTPVAVMDATYMTALRTGATAGLAVDVLAIPDASVLTLFGAGGQAQSLIDAVSAVRSIREIRIISRGGESARTLAAHQTIPATAHTDPAEALANADVVVTATPSTEPLFATSMLKDRVCIAAVGSHSLSMRELPADCFTDADVVVEHRDTALAEAGEIGDAIQGGFLKATDLLELGALLAGDADLAGRPRSVYKSVGNASEDIAIAREIYAKAQSQNAGTSVTL